MFQAVVYQRQRVTFKGLIYTANGLEYALFDLELLDSNQQLYKVKDRERDSGFTPSYSFGEATPFGLCLDLFSVAIKIYIELILHCGLESGTSNHICPASAEVFLTAS